MPSDKIRKLIPSIKKDLKSFMLEEKGGASKQALISFGALLASIQIVNVLSQTVAGANISAQHDHCDLPEASTQHMSGGWASGNRHSSAQGGPTNLCSFHASYAYHCSGTTSACAHKNSIYLTYG